MVHVPYNKPLTTGVRYESDDDGLMHAMLLELHIQVGVGKATGTPRPKGHDVARLWCEFTAALAAPRLCESEP